MDTITLDIPFLLLSTQANGSGETERRFLTPFGMLDLVFRPIWDVDDRDLHFEIDLKEGMENWLLPDQTFAEFKKSMFDFVREIARKHLEEVAAHQFEQLRVRMKGSEMHLHMPCDFFGGNDE